MKKGLWKCPLCGTSYAANGEEMTVTCVWVHIFRKDKWFKRLQEKLPKKV